MKQTHCPRCAGLLVIETAIEDAKRTQRYGRRFTDEGLAKEWAAFIDSTVEEYPIDRDTLNMMIYCIAKETDNE